MRGPSAMLRRGPLPESDSETSKIIRKRSNMMRFCIRKSCFLIYGVLNDDSWSSVYIAGAVEDKFI